MAQKSGSVSADGRSILYTPPIGHTGEDKFTYTVDGALKAEATVWVGTSVEEMLFRFDSLEELEQALLDDALQRYEHLFGQEGGGYDPFPYIMHTTTSDADSFGSSEVNASERSHSDTNVQVDGVDESDIIETDGDYLYVLSGGELIIAKAWPAEELSIASRLSIEGSPIGAYLHGERLTVISRLWENGPGLADSWDPWQYRPAGEKTLVTVYDVSDRGAPAIVERTELDGSYVESRRIDGTVFVVLRNNRVDLRLPGPEQIPLADDAEDWPEWVAPLVPVEGFLIAAPPEPLGGLIVACPPMPVGHSFVYETRDQYIERMREEIDGYLESVLPGYASYDADGELVQSGLLHAPEDVFRPLCPDVQRLVSVVSLNVGDDEAGITASTGIFTTGASEIYGSLDNLYVFDEQYTPEDGRVTQILKFDWNAETGGVELAARGQVAGSMLNQFSADQYKGYLRIATTIDNRHSGNWSGRSENVFFVLGEDGGVLEFVGGMQNLALGERIRSVRFMGERAFVSTFRDIDPLFALDFSDPADPQSRGYITMPGYNSYMQAIDQHHILTVGRNTPVGGSGPTQVSLFDVRDLSQPRLVDQYTFERFSTSEAEADHHAFGWFAEHQVLALPSARAYWERVDADGDGYRESRSPVREDELFIFGIDVTGSGRFDGGIELLGAIGHDSSVRRSAFIDDVLYSVANDSIEAVSIADPTVKFAEIRLDVGRPADAGRPEIFKPLFTAFDTSTPRPNDAHAEAGPELSPVGFGERADRDAFIFTAASGGDHVDALTATFSHHVLCGNLFFSNVAGIPPVNAFSQAGAYAGGSDVRASRYDSAPYRHKWEGEGETFTTRESLSSDLFDRALEAYDFDAVETTPSNQDAAKDFPRAVDLLMVQWDWPAELPGESSTRD